MRTIPPVDAASLLVRVLCQLQPDDKFQRSSPVAVSILECAAALSQWCNDEAQKLELK
jgi:hypothetical protein